MSARKSQRNPRNRATRAAAPEARASKTRAAAAGAPKATAGRALPPKLPRPPDTYTRFISRHPTLGRAWELVHEAGQQGPLDEKTARLVKLAVAIGAMREGAVHSAVRKARAMGIDAETIDQVVALAASTLGFPSTVAVFSWIDEA